jgi:hypothetical protein
VHSISHSQNLALSGVFDPKAKIILRPTRLDAECDFDRLVARQRLVSDFDPLRIEEGQRIARL